MSKNFLHPIKSDTHLITYRKNIRIPLFLTFEKCFLKDFWKIFFKYKIYIPENTFRTIFKMQNLYSEKYFLQSF